MELSLSSGGAAEALSWPEMFPGFESDSPLPPEELDAVVPVSGAMAGGMLDRILLESVCQQQSWVRVYGKDLSLCMVCVVCTAGVCRVCCVYRRLCVLCV